MSECSYSSSPSLREVSEVKLWLTAVAPIPRHRSEEHTSELQSQSNLVCRLLLEKKTNTNMQEIMSQVLKQSVSFQTALASIKLIQSSASSCLIEDHFALRISNNASIATPLAHYL